LFGIVYNTRSNLYITFVIAGNFDEIIARRTERDEQFVMCGTRK